MTKQTHTQIDLATIRARLANKEGQRFWQSLDELAETEEFQQFLRTEYPHGAVADLNDPVSRRTFLKLMGASLALAGLTSCSIGPLQPEERIVPYVVPPPEYTPGIPLFFASALSFGGFARGIVVESHEGRPTKIEGNFRHPASLGSTDIFTQATILTMYDPDRSQRIIDGNGNAASWDDFIAAVAPSGSGNGLRILTETVTSPTLGQQIQNLLDTFSGAKWYQYEPVNRDNVVEGTRLAFGEPLGVVYHFDKADVVFSLEADFMSTDPGSVRYTRDFMSKRRVRHEDENQKLTMNRLYVAESTPSNTGTVADHRLPLQSRQIEDLARQVASELGISAGSGASVAEKSWVEALVEDLETHSGSSIVIAGEQQPPVVHALAHAMNEKLGNVGETVVYTDPPEVEPVSQLDAIKDLVGEMKSGKVKTLVIIGGNPVYNAPADLDFAGNLANVDLSAHISLYMDETSSMCTWHVPAAHALESWGDIRAYDGTVSIVQPLIAPLYGGKTALEVVTALLGEKQSGYDVLREYWLEQMEDGSERAWELLLQDGLIEGTALPAKEVSLQATSFPKSSQGGDLEVVFRPDPTLWDGSFANNAWLQELPKPLSKVTWDNIILVSPATALEYGIMSEDVVQVPFAGTWVEGPVWVMPGQAYNSVTVFLGSGRTNAGNVGNNVGYDAYAIRTADSFWFGGGGDIVPLGQKVRLASTQHHQTLEVTNALLQQRMNERIPYLLRVGTLPLYLADPEFIHHAAHGGHGVPSLYPKFETSTGEAWDGSAWGMVIDLNLCNGCNACVAACNAENNIPVVGKDQVIMGREMHWIRIDRYYEGEMDNPNTYFQPLGCVQCEKAPCEPVCPVGATVHSLEGLNDMTYNRCVGTRYCGNNCPYKVRRFNFFNYAESFNSPSLNLMKNPNVTVRTRGVMEKCSYCVQRINAARIVSKREGIPIADGEIVTACEAACPTQAITFGNINDPFSRVSKLKHEPLNYKLLEDVGTVPRTSYLARLRNPNTKIEPVEVEVHQTEDEHTEDQEHAGEETQSEH
jgi:molybdopterin-containing oxidoreductase family iron-sulfur binding subunit